LSFYLFIYFLKKIEQNELSPLLLLLLGRKFWGFPFFAGSCASGHKAVLNQRSDVAELCSQMVRKLGDVYDPNNKVGFLSIVFSTAWISSLWSPYVCVCLDRREG
jgi:hypothetical protein